MYVCMTPALSGKLEGEKRFALLQQRFLRQYLYFCTSKASKLSAHLQPFMNIPLFERPVDLRRNVHRLPSVFALYKLLVYEALRY
jgi:hypothetical protein